MDETEVQVIGEENRSDIQKSRMWLARGGPPGKKVIWYEYHPTRAAYNAKAFLEGYSGYLQTDGYEGYDSAVKDMAGIVQVGCFAHARRKFFEADKISGHGKAIGYSLSQWDKLAAYLESPHLTPDNNACENAIRPFVIGRKNWLFCQSPQGAKSSCGMYSLIETAKRNGLRPFDYLTAVFKKAPVASSLQNWEKLLPWNIF